MLILKRKKSLKLRFDEGVYLMELIHDNDLASVSGGMSTEEKEFIAKSSVGASVGWLAGGIVGSYVGATQFRKYVLDNGEKSNSIVGAIINNTVSAGCSVLGGVIGFAVGAVASSI